MTEKAGTSDVLYGWSSGHWNLDLGGFKILAIGAPLPTLKGMGTQTPTLPLLDRFVMLVDTEVIPDGATIYEKYGNSLTIELFTKKYQSAIAPSDVEWTSDDDTVATVDDFGEVTLFEPGEANITATSKYNPDISTSCKVVVKLVTPINDPESGHYYTTALNSNGWTKENFQIIAKAGYLVGLNNTDAGPWVSSLTYEDETDGNTVTFYVRDEVTNYISLVATETYKLDKTPPIGKIKFGGNVAREMDTDSTYQNFFVNGLVITLTGVDDHDTTVEYYQSTTGNPPATESEWVMGDSLTLALNEKFVLYVRVTDIAGNQSIFHEGVVVYTNSLQDTQTVTHTKTATTDLVDAVALNDNIVGNIARGSLVLNASDYSVDGLGNITLKYSYLNGLSAGTYDLTVSYLPLGETFSENPGDKSR